MTSRDGTRIAFERSGEDPALVLVDGAFCFRALGPMAPLAELLAPDFTVYRYAARPHDPDARRPRRREPGLLPRRGAGDGGRDPRRALQQPGRQSWGRVDPEALAPLLRQFFA